ncbi:MAG TPA: NAD-dependent epimerase/dehydratase family protein [Actinomycetota bacterium]|nr:NAD-dependent epimerase/dehydratase family protein [Actinomycetota bacterium]
MRATGGTAFVTGGSGVVGRPVIAALRARGRSVIALARSEAARRTVAGLGATAVPGDIMDESALAEAMRGSTAVFHVAGANAFCVRDPSDMYRINVLGARNVVRAAAGAGVPLVVHTSSGAAIGERRGSVGTENTPHRGHYLSHYERSKHEAEMTVLAEADATGVDVVCVNPSSVQGPGRGQGTARLLRLFLDGKLRVFVDSTVSLVDIDDCARGHVLAEEHGRPGERYILSGATLRTADLVALLGRIAGVGGDVATIPAPAARAGAALVELCARAARREPPVCRETMRVLLHGHAYDGSRAARELGLVYTPIEDTLRRTAQWLLQEGLVTRPLPGLSSP